CSINIAGPSMLNQGIGRSPRMQGTNLKILRSPGINQVGRLGNHLTGNMSDAAPGNPATLAPDEISIEDRGCRARIDQGGLPLRDQSDREPAGWTPCFCSSAVTRATAWAPRGSDGLVGASTRLPPMRSLRGAAAASVWARSP